jgi:hypothetical protein
MLGTVAGFGIAWVILAFANWMDNGGNE